VAENWYAPSSSGSRSIYRTGGGSTSGSIYSGGSSGGSGGSIYGGSSGNWYGGTSTRRKRTKRSSGGVLGFLGRTFEDLKTAAVESPGGLYALGKAGWHDFSTSLIPPSHQTPEVAPIAKSMAVQTAADLRHSLRHPGYTLLDALGDRKPRRRQPRSCRSG
jgi:hypothetical protein